jgi:type I restriction enzyme, S subunit
MSSKLHTLKLFDCTTKIGSGATPTGGKSAYLELGSFALIRSQNILNEGFSRNGLAFIDEIQADKLKNVEVLTGDVLLNITGDSVARVCLVPDSVLPARVNQHVAIIRPDPKYLDNRFLKYYLLSEKQQNLMLSYASVGATRNALTKSMIEQFEIFCPSIAEQIKIANHLSDIDKRIDLLNETNQTLESIAQAIFKSWFIDFDPVHAKKQGKECAGIDKATANLFPSSFVESEFGQIPKDWRLGNIGEIANVIDCLHSKKPDLLEAGYVYLQLNNIKDDGTLDTKKLSYISEQDYKKWTSRIEVKEGDCIITNVGRVGAVCQIPHSFKAGIGRNITAIRLTKDYPYPTFLIHLLLSSVIKKEIKNKTDTGTILDALNVKSIPLLTFIIPKNNILDRFEAVTRPLRFKVELNNNNIEELSNLRDTLLPRLISGKLDLRNIEEQLEGVA